MKTINISTLPFLTIGLLIITVMTTACQPAVYLMPTPTAIKSGAVDPFARTPEELRDSDIQVGSATNRIPTVSKQSRINSTRFDQNLRLGAPNVDDISEEDAQWLIELSQTPKLSLIGIDAKTFPVVSKGAHDYWYKSPWISTDTMLELNIHATATERGLTASKGESGARIWHFPTDYEQRIDIILKKYSKELEHKKSQAK